MPLGQLGLDGLLVLQPPVHGGRELVLDGEFFFANVDCSWFVQHTLEDFKAIWGVSRGLQKDFGYKMQAESQRNPSNSRTAISQGKTRGSRKRSSQTLVQYIFSLIGLHQGKLQGILSMPPC